MFGMDLPAARGPAPDPADPSGFPSPARDYFHGGIDLNRHLIRDRTCTFIMRVSGDSMAAAGISDGDEIIVDRSLPPKDGAVVIAVLDGELAVRRLQLSGDSVALCAEPTSGFAAPTVLAELSELVVWGVVTRCLHHV